MTRLTDPLLDRPIRVLQLISSSATSGAERHTLNLTARLVERGHHVTLMCPSEGWLTAGAKESGATVHIAGLKGKDWFKTMNWLATHRGMYDIIHTHLTRAAYVGYAAGFFFRKPVVTSVHIANNDNIYKRLAHGHNRLVAVSGFVRGMLKGRGIADRYIDTIYNGTDFASLPRSGSQTVRQDLKIGQEKALVTLVGRVCRDKGQMELLRALKQLKKDHPNIHALFVGRFDPEFEPIVRRSVATLGLENQVTFAGMRNDVADVLDASDIATLPSYMETFGIAAIEAMGRSKAVVASKAGALPEVVRHGQTGLLIDLETDELSEAIGYLLREEAIRHEMGECGKRLVEEKFSLATMTEQFERTYAKALGIAS